MRCDLCDWGSWRFWRFRASVAFARPSRCAVPVGAAVVDITPDYPIRMVGYESRKTESEGIASRLKARALAIGGDETAKGSRRAGGRRQLRGRREGHRRGRGAAERRRSELKRERFVVCSTHTHCAPALSSGLDFIFGNPLPADQTARIERYTRELTDAIEKAALAALAARAPATLAWGQGRVGFAANRRVLKDGRWVNFGVNPNGPVDHSLPVLRATDAAGKVKAVLFGYACHCTTLGGEFNKICAEWAGYACDEIERQSPGRDRARHHRLRGRRQSRASAQPRRRQAARRRRGGREVDRLWSSPTLTPLPGRIDGRFRKLELPLEPPPGRAELAGTDQAARRRGFLARTLIERLDRGESLPTTVPYVVQTWCFGDDMAMVFLAGEVVVDYALRLKWEIDADRLWVAAYSNDVPCYIPSRRILSEGGYEADFSMIYYGHPSRFAPRPRT